MADVAERSGGLWTPKSRYFGSNFPNFPNFSGTRNGGIFADGSGVRPDPTATGNSLLAEGDPFQLSRAIENISTDTGFASLTHDVSGGAGAVRERHAQPLSRIAKERVRGEGRGGLAQHLVGRPLALAFPDNTGDMTSGRGEQAERERWR
jgi:hypothetical protein